MTPTPRADRRPATTATKDASPLDALLKRLARDPLATPAVRAWARALLKGDAASPSAPTTTR